MNDSGVMSKREKRKKKLLDQNDEFKKIVPIWLRPCI